MKKGIIILIAIIVVIIIILIYNSNMQTEYEYQYKFEEGKLLVSYKQDKWIEVPGDFTKTIEKLEINNNGEYEEDTYQISKHKTIFYYEKVILLEGNLEEDLNWSDVYDYYNIPTFENEILSLTVSQGADGDYNGGDTVTYISKDLGNTWEIQ